MAQPQVHKKPPFTEYLKNVPGFFGIRLNEEPGYRVLKKLDGVEIRRYDPMLVARTTAPGPYHQFTKTAFTRLADYIFGKNGASKTLSMTAPVFQEKAESQWRMSFVLPMNLTRRTAPKPKDRAVEVTQLPTRLVAVHSYSGTNNQAKMDEALKTLSEWLTNHPDYRLASDFFWAQYDSPMTIPFMKKNEAMVEVTEAAKH